MNKLISLYKKYEEQILYIFFGGLTTLVNLAVFFCSTRLLNINELWATIIGFILSVLFAYVTNRIFVFKSKAKGIKNIVREVTSFFGCRLFSGGLDLALTAVFITWLQLYDVPVKIIINIVVIVLNYLFSKLFIFKKK